jgi:hypothetical protein
MGSSFCIIICKSGTSGELMDYHNQILNGDCLKVLEGIPENSVDLIVTS